MTILAAALTSARKSRKERQDITAFNALFETPGDLAAGIVLPANVKLYVSTSSVLAATTVLLDVGGVDYGAPAQAANVKYHTGSFEKDVTVAKKAGAPGTVSVYAMDGLGVLRKFGEG